MFNNSFVFSHKVFRFQYSNTEDADSKSRRVKRKQEFAFGRGTGTSRSCPRTADGPRPQQVGPLGRTAKTKCFCAWPCAANRDGSRSAGGSAKMRPCGHLSVDSRLERGQPCTAMSASSWLQTQLARTRLSALRFPRERRPEFLKRWWPPFYRPSPTQ